jgi:hypothetical protein
MGILPELTERTEAELERIRRELAGLGDDNAICRSIEEREVELVLPLDDLENHRTSPRVLDATAHIRGRGVDARSRSS